MRRSMEGIAAGISVAVLCVGLAASGASAGEHGRGQRGVETPFRGPSLAAAVRLVLSPGFGQEAELSAEQESALQAITDSEGIRRGPRFCGDRQKTGCIGASQTAARRQRMEAAMSVRMLEEERLLSRVWKLLTPEQRVRFERDLGAGKKHLRIARREPWEDGFFPKLPAEDLKLTEAQGKAVAAVLLRVRAGQGEFAALQERMVRESFAENPRIEVQMNLAKRAAGEFMSSLDRMETARAELGRILTPEQMKAFEPGRPGRRNARFPAGDGASLPFREND